MSSDADVTMLEIPATQDAGSKSEGGGRACSRVPAATDVDGFRDYPFPTMDAMDDEPTARASRFAWHPSASQK